MSKLKLFAIAVVVIALAACQPNNVPEFKQIITLDCATLSTYTFDDNGAWTGTYHGELSPITLGEFTFSHFGTQDYFGYPNWEGWTICNSPNTTYSGDYATEQWNIVAGGGRAGLGKPYMLAYCGNYNVQNDILFSTQRSPKEIFFCQSAWSAYCIEGKDAYTRKFKQGDYLTVTIHALDAESNIIEGKEVVYYLADCRAANQADWHINTGWESCDLSPLGKCHGMRFSFASTDSSDFGSNTAQYFAIDCLTVEE